MVLRLISLPKSNQTWSLVWFWTETASINFGCMHGLTPAGNSQIHEGKSLRWIHNRGKSKFIWWSLNKTLIKRKNESHAYQAKTTRRSWWCGRNKKCNLPYPSPGRDDANSSWNAIQKSCSADLKWWALAEGKSVFNIFDFKTTFDFEFHMFSFQPKYFLHKN